MGGEEMFNGFQIFIESLLSRVSDMPWWAVFIPLNWELNKLRTEIRLMLEKHNEISNEN